MELYLVRHTTPDIIKGTCYGQTDLDTTESFLEEAAAIKQHLPQEVKQVYSSPLKRCRKLATFLFPHTSIKFDDRLKEVNCGAWEMKHWDHIEEEHLQRWMNDFVNISMPEGESYLDLHQRVVSFFNTLSPNGPTALVTHGGVIRSLLSYINETELQESFNIFSIRYGCVVKIEADNDRLKHAILHNPIFEQEQHRPSNAAF